MDEPVYTYDSSQVRLLAPQAKAYLWDDRETTATITATGIHLKQFCQKMRHTRVEQALP